MEWKLTEVFLNREMPWLDMHFAMFGEKTGREQNWTWEIN